MTDSVVPLREHNPRGHLDEHPGHAAADCGLRETVLADPLGSSSNGYRCAATGGHCLPGSECNRRRDALDARQLHEAMLTMLRRNDAQ